MKGTRSQYFWRPPPELEEKMIGDTQLLTAWLKYLKSQKRFKRNVCKRNIYEDAGIEFLSWLREQERQSQ